MVMVMVISFFFFLFIKSEKIYSIGEEPLGKQSSNHYCANQYQYSLGRPPWIMAF
jgi:hypothetical protein